MKNIVSALIFGSGSGGGGGGDNNYNNLDNLPKMNNHTITGNKSGNDYGLVNQDDSLTEAQMNALLALIPD